MYTPPDDILNAYADVMINFAVGGGEGIKEGEVVLLQVPESAKPLLLPLQQAVLGAGAHPLMQYIPDGVARPFYENATEEQLTFFPGTFLKGRVDQVDHMVAIIAEHDKHELEGIDPKRIMSRSKSFKPYREWRDEKEHAGKFTWTLGLYGTPAMAAEAKLSLEEYWQQIIKACYLDEEDPVEKWRETQKEVHRVRDALNDLHIEKVHVEAEHADIWLTIGEKRLWKGGGGRNIPSFEVFTSPDWRGTNGEIRFTEPLYRYGQLITDVYLRFEEGVVVEARASKNEDFLREMIDTEGADKVGEFSLTDGRLSRITKFMAETLYDENVGGPNGNTHIAVGMAYKDCYDGDPSQVSKEEWERLGYNDSVVHTDIVSTEPRKVTAVLGDGSEKVIYDDGKFLV